MPATTPPTNPDSLAILHALSRDGLSPEDAYNALEGVRNMSGQTVAAAIEAQSAKTDAQISKLDAKLDAQTSRLDTQISKLDSKLDAQISRLDSKLDAQNATIRAQNTQLAGLRWMIGIGFTLLALLTTLLRLIG